MNTLEVSPEIFPKSKKIPRSPRLKRPVFVDLCRAVIDDAIETGIIGLWSKKCKVMFPALSIHLGLFMQFPKEVESSGIKESLQRAFDLQSFAIWTNDWLDIGLSAKIRLEEERKRGITAERYAALSGVEKKLRGKVEESKNLFLDKHVTDLPANAQEIIDAYLHDVVLISNARENETLTPSEIIKLDSAANEAFFMSIAVPKIFEIHGDILQKHGLDMTKKCGTPEELRNKYSVYLKNAEELIDLPEAVKKIAQLHAISMGGIKFTDDKKGGIDAILGIPNLYQLPEERQELKKRFDEILSKSPTLLLVQAASGLVYDICSGQRSGQPKSQRFDIFSPEQNINGNTFHFRDDTQDALGLLFRDPWFNFER